MSDMQKVLHRADLKHRKPDIAGYQATNSALPAPASLLPEVIRTSFPSSARNSIITDLQLIDPLCRQPKKITKDDRTAREISSDVGAHLHPIALHYCLNGFGDILIFLSGSHPPFANGLSSAVGIPFILHHRIRGKSADNAVQIFSRKKTCTADGIFIVNLPCLNSTALL